MGPHVQLNLLGQPELVVHHISEAVPGPGPGFDLEAQDVAVRGRAELDLPGLDVSLQGGQAERGGVPAHHPDRAVPRPGHAHHELVAVPKRAVRAARLTEHGHLGRSLVQLRGHLVDEDARAHAGIRDVHRVQAMQQGTDAGADRLAPVTGWLPSSSRSGRSTALPVPSERCRGMVRHMYRQLTTAIPTGQLRTIRSRPGRLTTVMSKSLHGVQPSHADGVCGERSGA